MDDSTLDALLAVAPVAAVVVGHDHTIRAWNPAAAAITGWSADEVLGRTDPMVPEGQRDRTADALDSLLAASSEPGRVVLPRVRRDGSRFQLCLEAAAPVDLDDGPGVAMWFSEATDLEALVLHRGRLSRRLVGATRVDEVVPLLVEAVTDVLGAGDAVVLRRCASGQHLHGVRGLGTDPESAGAVELDLGGDRPWDLAVDGRVADGELDRDGEARAASFVPMGPEEEGWVLATTGTRAAGAGPHVQDLFRAVADEAWAALQRAELVAELDGKIEILEATNRLAGSVGLDLDDALDAVSRQAADALSCARAAVYLVDPDSSEVVLAHLHADDAPVEELLAEDEGVAFAREVVARGEEVLCEDASRCGVAEGPWDADTGAVAVMGLPLLVASRRVGALVVAHTAAQPREFTVLSQQVGAAVAQQAALAVEHARLFSAERHNVQRLEELDRLKADWMAGVTHDLKAPVTTLLGFVETLRRMIGHVTEDEQRRFLEIMSRQANRLVSLIEDLLLSARVEADAAARRRELVDVAELVDAAIDAVDHDDRHRISVDPGEVTASVLGDRAHLHRVLVNLLSNALLHGGHLVRIVVGHDAGRVLVAVEDDGPGVPLEDRDRIFDRFVHGQHESSSGLGLYVARGIVEAHDGTIRVTDRPDGEPGARFELRLPRGRRQREQDLADEQVTEERRRSDVLDPRVGRSAG